MNLSQSQFARHLNTATKVGVTGALAASVAIGGMTHEAPKGDYQPMGPITAEKFWDRYEPGGSVPQNIPRWNKNLSQQFPGFRDIEKKPEDALNSHVVGVNSQNRARVYPAQKAWDLNTDKERANDVWYVGAKW